MKRGVRTRQTLLLFDLQLQIRDEAAKIIPAQSKEWLEWMGAEGACQQWFWVKRALLSQLDFPNCSL